MDQFKGQTEAYIKFLFFHALIAFTVIYALLNALSKLESSEFDKRVDEIKNLAAYTDTPIETGDYLLDSLYFYERSVGRARKDTLQTPLPDSVLEKKKEELKKQIAEVRKISKDAFLFKISFLGNLDVDLRYWVFILPLFLIFSIIYIFILDFKIVLLKKIYRDQINENLKHPFSFLRNLLLILEVLMIVTYGIVFFKFLSMLNHDYFLNITWTYILISYYGLLYCLYLKYKLKKEAEKDHFKYGFPENIFVSVYRVFVKIMTYPSKLVMQRVFAGVSQALIISTLFLVMTYSSCSESGQAEMKAGYPAEYTDSTGTPSAGTVADPLPGNEKTEVKTAPGTPVIAKVDPPGDDSKEKNTVETASRHSGGVKGYELILTSKKWESWWGSMGFAAIFTYVLKYLYTATVAGAMLLTVFYFRRKRPHLKPRRHILAHALFYFSIINAVVFTVYFGDYSYLTPGNLDLLFSFFILWHWYVFFGKKILSEKTANYGMTIYGSLFVYCLPFFISGLVNCINNFEKRDGWIVFLPAIWLMMLTLIIINRNINQSPQNR